MKRMIHGFIVGTEGKSRDPIWLHRVSGLTQDGRIIGPPQTEISVSSSVDDEWFHRFWLIRESGLYVICRDETPMEWYCVEWDGTETRAIRLDHDSVKSVRESLIGGISVGTVWDTVWSVYSESI